jgi:Transcriptional regulator PadR-like family
MPPATVGPSRTHPERPRWTAILRLLEERASHGYELVARLNEAGTVTDTVGVYRALRAMEAEGIVTSTWDVSQGVRPGGSTCPPQPATPSATEPPVGACALTARRLRRR